MFALGIPNRQYRRTTQVLGHESSEPIPYQAEKQEDGFYLFMFPKCDEYDFRKIVKLLKISGVTTIGADTQLTEKNIMKLTDLIKESNILKEKNFDKRLAQQMGMSDDEFEDKIASRDIGDTNPFMDDDDDRSPGEELADRTIEDFRKKYRGMSDQDMDDFSAKMVEHLLDNIAAQARAKVFFARKGI
jgi:hypothetical protein